ncbi:MAG TPA: hypothetical protein VG944_05055, partial [Fimbriimonas sp.]|nr:hypothetical protein [Fimbriimonas sp.]
YANDIWIDPTNTNRVVISGTYTWRSVDGGVTFTKISNGYIQTTQPHPDDHHLVPVANYDGSTHKGLYVTTDGGIFYAPDITVASTSSGWTNCDQTPKTTQFYSVAGDSGTGAIIGGTQDNGTQAFQLGTTSASWTFGGDGGYTFIDPTDPNYVYSEYIGLQIERSTAGAFTRPGGDPSIWAGENDQNHTGRLWDTYYGQANFIAPIQPDPNNPLILFGGGLSLWKSANPKDGIPHWTALSNNLGGDPYTPNDYISTIAVATGHSNIIWLGLNNGTVAMTTNGTTASPTWNVISGPNNASDPLPNRMVTKILVDPNDTSGNTVYCCFGGFTSNNLWKTTNGGGNWASVTGTGGGILPQVPIRALAIKPHTASTLYVGTEIGIFSTSNGATTWTTSGDGPNDATIYDLEYMNNSSVLLAGTHGRGVWVLSHNSTVSQVRCSPNTSEGGKTTHVIVTLTSPAPAGGLLVKITTSGPVTATTAIRVPAGLSTYTFSATTVPVSTQADGTITGTVGATQQSGTVTVTPPTIKSFYPAAASVVGGSKPTTYVVLSSKAPAGGMPVQITCSGDPISVPSDPVVVPAGTTFTTFKTTTVPVSSTVHGTLTATLGSQVVNTNLTVSPPYPTNLSIVPNTVQGSSATLVQGTVTLVASTPPAGVTVHLSSDTPSACSVPATLLVKGTHGTFTLSQHTVATPTTVTITATYNGVSVTGTLTVNP